MRTSNEYRDMIFGDLFRFSGSKRTKKNRETCPDCGSKLVNIYYNEGVWKCKKCWDKLIELVYKEE